MDLAPSALATTPENPRPVFSAEEWEHLQRWIKLYSWAQIAFLTILIGALHAVPLLGQRWSCCMAHGTGATNWWCVLFFHLYEIPLAALFVYHIRVGFKPLTLASLPYYTFLTLFQLVMLFVFVTFESKTLLDALGRQAPDWEIAVIFGGCTGMLIDSLLGFYIVFRRILPAYIASRRLPER